MEILTEKQSDKAAAGKKTAADGEAPCCGGKRSAGSERLASVKSSVHQQEPSVNCCAAGRMAANQKPAGNPEPAASCCAAKEESSSKVNHEDSCCAAKDEGSCCDCHKKHRTEAEYKALMNRLSRIEGQVRGIRQMLEEDRYCVDILTQVAAAKSALDGFGRVLLNQHIHTCVVDKIREGDDDAVIDELCGVVQKLMR